MKNINAPPRRLKSSTGIDSVFIQYRGINKFDVDHFCRENGWSYKGNERGKYTRKWKIFLAGGHPITVVYHFLSKTTTFQIGKLMNYSRNLNDSHDFLQKLMLHYSDKKMQISGLHFAVDVNEPICLLTLKSNLKLKSEKHTGSTVYLNGSNGTVMTMYDKSTQMQIYSTSLTRFELRFSGKHLSQWKIQDFTENRRSLEKLASGIKRYFEKRISVYTVDRKTRLVPDTGDIIGTLEDFIAFLHGGNKPVPKDHFKVRLAIQARDTLFMWMRHKGIKDINSVNAFVKGKKAQCLKEIGIDHKTFNKAINFYKGIPNFKIPA